MNAWIEQWFSAKQAQHGGIVRRNKSWILKHASVEEVLEAARERGWHVVGTGSQLLVLCRDDGDLQVLC